MKWEAFKDDKPLPDLITAETFSDALNILAMQFGLMVAPVETKKHKIPASLKPITNSTVWYKKSSKDDLASAVASRMFNVPVEKVTAQQRKAAKAALFPILYGRPRL